LIYPLLYKGLIVNPTFFGFLQVLLTHVKQEPASPEPELLEVDVEPAVAFPYLMDPNQAFQPPPPSTPPRGMPQIIRQEPAGLTPIEEFLFLPGPLDIRIPAFNASYNPSLTHKEHNWAFSLPTSAVAMIVVALDARRAHLNGQNDLSAAHYAYANGEIYGKSLLYYLCHHHHLLLK
jgi:hypothetical protein